jgi:hypothetical protein
MMKRIILAASAAVLFAGLATAQTTTPTNPPPPAQDQRADGPDGQDDGGWFGWGHRGGRHGDHGGRGPGGPGGRDGGGPRGMQMDGKGFRIMVGPGHGLSVNCGQEPMKECIASAQPLIDALGKLDFKPPAPPAQ